MTEAAACSFCSRKDPSVTVICDGRCLICNRCQCSGNIRRLLVDSCDVGLDITGQEADPECPLCELPFVPPMLATIRTYRRDLNNIVKVVDHLNMGTAPIPLHTLVEKVIRANNRAASDETMAEGGGGNKPAIRNPELERSVTIADLTPQTMLSLFCDIVVDMWGDYRRNHIEPITICCVRQISRRKTTTANKEHRLRNLLDMLGKPAWEIDGKVDAHSQASTNAALSLFGKLMGVRPKVATAVRPVHGLLVVSLLVMMTNDSCIRSQRLLSDDNKPSPEEVRNKFGKFAYRPMPVRRLISSLRALFACDEPHWTMSSLKAICTECCIALPWREDAVSRLLHSLLSLTAFPDSTKTTAAPSSFIAMSAQDQRKRLGAEMRGNYLLRAKNIDRRVSLVFRRTRGNTDINPNPKVLGAPPHSSHQHTSSSQPSSRPSSPSRPSSRLGTPHEPTRNHSYEAKYDEVLSWDAAYEQAGALTCDVFLMVAVVVEAWENEVIIVQDRIKRAILASQRRGGMVGSYDVTTGSMNVEERTCMRRLVRHYLVQNRERVVREREELVRQREREDQERLQAIEDAKKAEAKAARQAKRAAKAGGSAGLPPGKAPSVKVEKGGNKGKKTLDLSEEEVAALEKAEADAEALAELRQKEEEEYQEKFKARRETEDAAWLRAKEQAVWVDWAEMRRDAFHRRFPFAVPDSLVKKSDAQLQHHFGVTLKQVRMEEETEDVDQWPDYGLHDFDYFPLFGYPDGLRMFRRDVDSAATHSQQVAAVFGETDQSAGGDLAFGTDSVSTNPSIADLLNPTIGAAISNDMHRYDDRFSRISQRLRTSLPVLPHLFPGATRDALSETDKPLRVLSVVERHLLMKNMETQPDTNDSPGATAGAGAGTPAAIGTVEDKLSFLTSGAKLSGVRIQHRTPKGDFQLPVSVTREVPRAPAGPLDGPVVGKHKVSFVDLLTPGAKEPQLVLAKTGLVPAMHAGQRWDETQFEANMERISSLASFGLSMDTSVGEGADKVKAPVAQAEGGPVLRSESAPVLPGRRLAGVGKDALSLEQSAALASKRRMESTDSVKAQLAKSASEGLMFVPFDSDMVDGADIDYEDYDDAAYATYNMDGGHDVEALSQERAFKRLTRGLFRDDNSANSLNPLSTVGEEVSQELSLNPSADPFTMNASFTESLFGASAMTNSADGGSLLDRALAPVGSQSRAKLDMSHYTQMQPSELPRVGESGVHMLVLRDAKLGTSDAQLDQFRRVVLQTCIGPRSAALRMIDLGGNALGFKGAHIFADEVHKGNLGGGLPLLEVLSAPGNDLKDTGAVVLLDSIRGQDGTAIADGGLVKLDLRNNALLMGADLSAAIGRVQSLRVLDLSWNGITLVSKAQMDGIKNCLMRLGQLQVFSFAYNRIQDKGATAVCEALIDHCPELKVLDLSYCFISSESRPAIERLLQLPKERPLKVLLLFGIVLNRTHKEELKAMADEHDRRLVRTGHHTGIELIEDYFYEPAPEDVFKGPARGRLPPKHSNGGGGGSDACSVVSSGSLTTATTVVSGD